MDTGGRLTLEEEPQNQDLDLEEPLEPPLDRPNEEPPLRLNPPNDPPERPPPRKPPNPFESVSCRANARKMTRPQNVARSVLIIRPVFSATFFFPNEAAFSVLLTVFSLQC